MGFVQMLNNWLGNLVKRSSRFFRYGFLTLVFLGSILGNTVLAAEPGKAWAYFAWWLPQSWQSAPLNQLDRLLFFELKVNPQGLINERNGWPEKWVDLRAALNKNATPLDLTLTILSERDFQTLFSSGVATRQLLEQATALADDSEVAGLHLDFEVFSNLPQAVQTRFRQFVVDLSSRLRSLKPSKNLSVFLPIGGASQIYDARSIGQVDYVVAQGYDSHWASGPSAGPVSPLDGSHSVTWKKAIGQALALGARRDKLLLSYPLYGYEWPTQDKNPQGLTRGVGVTTTLAPVDPRFLPAIQVNIQDRVKSFGSSNDPQSASSFYQFQKDGQWTTGWYEGQWALDKKIKFLEQQKLGGAAFFLLGYDDGKVMDTFLKRRGPKKLRSCIGGRCMPQSASL
jgi:spore germination protein